jgi:esterase/lipase
VDGGQTLVAVPPDDNETSVNMERQPDTVVGLGLSWCGALATWLAESHTVLALVATAAAIGASIYTIRAQRATAKLRDLEIAEHKHCGAQHSLSRDLKCPRCGKELSEDGTERTERT